MISALDQLLIYNIQNDKDDSPASVALSIFKICSCLWIQYLKRRIYQKETTMVSHCSQNSLAKKMSLCLPKI